jgi:hypothetical protein
MKTESLSFKRPVLVTLLLLHHQLFLTLLRLQMDCTNDTEATGVNQASP